MDNARRMGERLLAGLRELQPRHEVIGDVRGLGLFVGIELVEDRKTKAPATTLAHELEQSLFQKGLLVLQCGESVIRMAPPLVIDEHDVDVALQIFDECLSEMTR
jgi:4-aminobutyrate aminotransferase